MDEPRRRGPGLWSRVLLYAVALLVLAAFRFVPSLRFWPTRTDEPAPRFLVSGLDLAPTLIARLAKDYQRLAPAVDLRLLPGGTKQSLEDLLNRRADAAFLSRLPTREESAIIRSARDSILSYPIALGGIVLLAGAEVTEDSIHVRELRRWLKEERGGPKIYAPDPNLGLFTALCVSLGIPERAPAHLSWLASERDVLDAVGNDPGSVGIVSSFTLPPDLARSSAHVLAVKGDTSGAAFTPSAEEIARGDYPLHHYLYVSCRADGGGEAAAFVTHLYSGRGQRLVSHLGFLPAREVAREIVLTKPPVGGGS